MTKWKCEICGNGFENFHAQGFDHKIYCPLCYFKKENQELKKQLEEYKKDIEDLDNQKQRAFENMQLNQLKVCNIARQQKEFIKCLKDMYHINIENDKELDKLKTQLEGVDYTVIPNSDIKPLIDKFRTQQKEFIKYLEDEINKWHYNYDSYNYKYEVEEPTAEELANEILQKYKEIIGSDK